MPACMIDKVEWLATWKANLLDIKMFRKVVFWLPDTQLPDFLVFAIWLPSEKWTVQSVIQIHTVLQ